MHDSDRAAALLAQGLAEVLALAKSGSHGRALARVVSLSARFPGRTEPLMQWAALLLLAGQPDAREPLTRCLELDPEHALANRLLGEILLEQGLASPALPHIEKALRRAPNDRRTWWLSAQARAISNDTEGALGVLANARRQWPEAPDLADLEGRLLSSRGAWHAAAAALRTASRSDPQSASRLGDVLLQLGMPAAGYLAYRRAERGLGGCPATGSRALFASQFLACNPRLKFEAHRRWARRYAPGPHRDVGIPNPSPERLLRVALVSPRLRSASATFLLTGLIEHWPKGLSLHCYAEQDEEDLVSQRIRARCSGWVCTTGLDDMQLADRIAADRIDIVIDLAGHTPGNRVPALARCPAPIVLSWLDYCDTTGSHAFDGLITDAIHSPRGGAQLFTERLLRLDPLRFCYQPPAGLPDVAPGGQRPARAPVFGAFHRFAKLGPAVLAAWARLLHALPEARLIIRNDALVVVAEHDLHRQRLAAAGLPIERVEFKAALPHRDYLAAYEEIDIALDTFPYNGGVTTLEALIMGRPVVTVAGATLISRQSAAILRAMGLQELIADGPEHYVSLAAELAVDTGRLGALSRGLRERMLRSPVCDAPGFARRFGALLREAWRARCRGEAIGEST